MKVTLQVLGINSGETSPSLALFAEGQRYIFNAGDGTQRICNEYKIRMAKSQDIFVTAVTPQTLCGLPGLMLTLLENEPTKKKLHGPPGINAFIQSAHSFLYMDHFSMHEYNIQDYAAHPYYMHANHEFADKNFKFKIFPMFTGDYDLPTSSGSVYLIQGPKPMGKFLIEKARELGIPRGPLYAKLSKGESVEVDGRIIHSEEVVGEAGPALGLVIVHLTDEGQLRQLPQFQLESQIQLVVHLSPTHLLMTDEYRNFLSQISNTAMHYVINEESSPQAMVDQEFISRGAFRNQIKLNYISPNFFHLNKEFIRTDVDIIQDIKSFWMNQRVRSPSNLTTFTLSPIAKVGEDLSTIPPLVDKQEIIDSIPKESDTIPLEMSLSEEDYRNVVSANVPGYNPEIMILGTGSMKPSKYRNVSAIYLNIPYGGILLDCGEATYNQLYLQYGDKIGEVLSGLKAILITHMHADHHLGTVRVLKERTKYTNDQILVVAPYEMHGYLITTQMLFGNLQFNFMTCGDAFTIEGICAVQPVPVIHRVLAYGFVLQHDSGWKIVYSGDTRPCDALVEAGLGATLLIHEATFEDSMQQDAIQKTHSTFSEAITVGRAMGAWCTLLTHFSQRYPQVAENMLDRAILAYDHMRFHLKDALELLACQKRLARAMATADETEDEDSQQNLTKIQNGIVSRV